MLRIYLCIVFFLVEVAVISRGQNVDCSGLPSSVQPRVQTLVGNAGGGEGNGLVAITAGPNYTCQVQGTVKGTYQELSVIVEYTLDGVSPRRRQLELFCENGGTGNTADNSWSEVENSLTTPTETDIPVFTNCSSCGSGNINRCMACDPECNVGLMRCTGTSSSMCCVAFEEDGTCKPDLNCTSTNFVANEQNNYTCACGLDSASCDPGYIFTNVTDCSCVLNDICMTQPPLCNNNGSCILNTAPDNSTCNCTGTGFMGTNCEVEIPLSSSSTVVSSTVQEPSSVTSTTTTTIQSTTQAVTSTSSSTIVAPSSTTLLQADDGPYIPVIVASSIFGLLLIIILIILIIYIIYYLKSGNGFVVAKTKASAPFADGESHNNPLYLKPDDVVSEVATLYTP